MRIAKNDIEKLRLQFDKVYEIAYKAGNKEYSVVVRKPHFDEYLYFNKHVINYAKSANAKPVYELDIEVADDFFTKIVVYPEQVDMTKIPAGMVQDACVRAIELCNFENPSALKNMYLNSFKHAYSVLGVITQRLLASYGIQVFTAMKYFTEEEIMDLVVISELVHGDTGMLAKVADMKDLPFDRRGKLDLNQLFGIKEEGVNKEGKTLSPFEAQLKEKAKKYYRSMGVSEERINQVLRQRDAMTPNDEDFEVQTDGKPTDKTDINAMDDKEVNNLPYDKYMQLKKDGKLMNYEESLSRATNNSKTALAQKIEADKQKYGDSKKTKPIDDGTMQTLLKRVKDTTRDIE